MDKDNYHDNLNTLKEMILDERKLVTYVSLSKEMCLHVNESKSLLSQIVEDLRKNTSEIQLNVNYIISGLLDGNKARTTVCNENELPSLKKDFKIVFYHHLYSVSVGTPSADNVSFMAINKFEDFPLCTGIIKSNACMKRSSDEIGNLKTNSQEITVTDQKQSIAVQKKVREENKNGSNTKPAVKIQETKAEPIIKAETVSPKKESTINSLQKPALKNTKTQKGIAGFFSKPSANKPVNGTKDKVSKINVKQEESNTVINDNEPKNNIKKEKVETMSSKKIKTEKMDVDEEVPKKVVPEKVPKNVKQSDKKENKSLSDIKKTAKLDKKRKRVLHVSDSESEDEKNDPFATEPVVDQDSDDEIPPTPLVNTVKITSGIMNPKKRRKMVDKTYTDEDGYILTKKEEVYESCSENEEEIHVKENIHQVNTLKVEVSPPEKKNNGKSTKKKMASPQKGKQATLMNFFKKV